MPGVAHGNSQNLRQLPGSLHGTDLGLLHIYDCCIAWPICGTPSNGSKDVPGALTGSWESISKIALPSLNSRGGA